jgi:SAM-dependent methyltransferase
MSVQGNYQPFPSSRERANQSGGTSQTAVRKAISQVIQERHSARGALLDVGCGAGELWNLLQDRFDRYIGADLVRYERFPAEGRFHLVDLDCSQLPIPNGSVDVVASVETIEHVENPRAFMRELARVLKPGGFLYVSTPNQLSALSKLTLILKNQFNAFQEGPGLYPAHLTALLEIDLLRIARECGLRHPDVIYTNHGRIPLTARHWPSFCGGRLFSDNIMLVARKGSE